MTSIPDSVHTNRHPVISINERGLTLGVDANGAWIIWNQDETTWPARDHLLWLLPLLEEPSDVVAEAVSRVGVGENPLPALLRFALTSDSHYWAELALGWVEAGVFAGELIVDALQALKDSPQQPQPVRHRALRLWRKARVSLTGVGRHDGSVLVDDARLWQLLRSLDDPDRLEFPADYDHRREQARFAQLSQRLDAEFGCSSGVDRHVQDASFHGRITVPASMTATGRPLVLVVSNFGGLAVLAVDNPGVWTDAEAERLLDTRDAARIGAALTDLGYTPRTRAAVVANVRRRLGSRRVRPQQRDLVDPILRLPVVRYRVHLVGMLPRLAKPS